MNRLLKKIASQHFALSWFWLVVLTFASVAAGYYFQSPTNNSLLFIAVVMLIIAMKGQQVIDVFMELKQAPKLWRYVMLSYVVIIPLLITIIYL